MTLLYPAPVLYVTFDVAFVLLLMILFHELGHWLYFKYGVGKLVSVHMVRSPVRIEVGDLQDYLDLDSRQKSLLYLSGILLGLVPLLLASTLLGYILALGFYCMGIKHDMTQCAKHMRKVLKSPDGV